MEIKTAWLKPSSSKTGRDHMGVQGPCINIYGQLLPGITNVTDRARYYSFYPWLLWGCRQHYINPTWNFIIERFRRAECLFTLIAARHSKKKKEPEDHHGIGMVGRNTLTPLIDIIEKGESIKLSQYATLDDASKDRYFKNKLGGLGQYYAGPLLKLGILGGNSKSGFQYTRERGEVLAEAFDVGVDSTLFFRTVDDDTVTLDILDALYAFCPCRLKHNHNEQSSLVDLFFDRKNLFAASGLRRRQTLCLYLDLIKSLEKQNVRFDHHVFRNCVYTGCLPGGKSWGFSQGLLKIQDSWRIFQKNELISIALQGVFWVGLSAIEEQQRKQIRFSSVESFAQWFVQSANLKEMVGEKLSKLFSSVLSDARQTLPAIDELTHPLHEMCMATEIIQRCQTKASDNNPWEVIRLALGILTNIILRDGASSNPYGNILLPEDYMWYYPINLDSFTQYSDKEWPNMKLSEVIVFLVGHWGIENHFRVAMRKLRYDQRDTFQVRPTENGLEWEKSPKPIYTNPRFVQGVRMLWDLDAIEPINGNRCFQLTNLGQTLVEEYSEH